jgi:hypothetical protein
MPPKKQTAPKKAITKKPAKPAAKPAAKPKLAAKAAKKKATAGGGRQNYSTCGRYDGKTVLVTGGSMGIGEGCVSPGR